MPIRRSFPPHYYLLLFCTECPTPTRQVLQDAANNLRPIEAIQAVVPNWPPLEDISEEVVVGQVVGEPNPSKLSAEVDMPPAVVNFEDENGVDDAGAFKDACAKLDRLVWNEEDLPFFISQVEIKLKSCGVKNNYTKLTQFDITLTFLLGNG